VFFLVDAIWLLLAKRVVKINSYDSVRREKQEVREICRIVSPFKKIGFMNSLSPSLVKESFFVIKLLKVLIPSSYITLLLSALFFSLSLL
jgi:hypothetical protein